MKTFKTHMEANELHLMAVLEHMNENNINPDDLTEEELNEIIGKVIGGAAKLAAKGIRRAVQNKQGNFRFSRAGRNDARQAKIDSFERKKKELKREKKTRADLKKARQDYQDAKKAHNNNP